MLNDTTRFALLEGTRVPQTEQERYYLTFMGGPKGPRESWPNKWCVCDTCNTEWNARAFFPSPTGHWIFPYRCPECLKKSAEREWPATNKAGKQKAGKQNERKDLWN